MDFNQAAQLGNYLSKDYTKDFFRLLVNYRDVSASEAASRLGLHIRTAQDFLEAMEGLGILAKEEVYEKKRPYFRYRILTKTIHMDIDLSKIEQQQTPANLARKIREKPGSRASFSMARDGEHISQVSLLSGEGRDQKARKISLTRPQGIFLYHLPFPNTEPLSILEIMHKADIAEELAPEIIDIVEVLEKHGAIEVDQ